ncbi:MAG: hypothetical protein ACD_49C00077G0031 [uncultured bacterium (gcode 4)]|uniref:Uncharacterized protein n=1 Tax=uncultured bacterium (gcode 4) TaxID=1234023 RepID=K2BAV9_9BACT|nr:MAG: hypothetical protein ACD_49C00077G0031 [uncultured bacterium (gcode 4)]
MSIPLNHKREVSLAPLDDNKKSFILDNLLKDSKTSIINFYKREIAIILISLKRGAKKNWANRKIQNLIEKDAKRIVENTDKTVEKIKKLGNKWSDTFNEIFKLLNDNIKNDPFLSKEIDAKQFDIILKELLSIYLFIEKDNIDLLIRKTETSIKSLLNPEISAILRDVKNKFDIVFDFYWSANFCAKKFFEETKDLTMDIKLLKLQLEEKDKEIISIKRAQRKTETALKSKGDEAERLRQDREKLSKKIEELENKLASMVVMEENMKNQQNSFTSWEDNVVWEEIALNAEFELGKMREELQEIKKENIQLLGQIESLNWQIQNMENLKIKFAQFSTIEAFLEECELDIDNLESDEIIKYLSLIDCPINLKQKAIKAVIHFIDNIFLKNISKWASSSTTWVWGVSWGKYANNFINPILNFVKEKAKMQWSQNFIEFLSNINWKELIEEYKETNDYKTKKDRVMSNVFVLVKDNEEYMGFFEALSYLWEKFKEINLWNTDLQVLCSNIKEVLLDTDYTKRELKKLVTKASYLRKK